MLRFGPGKYFAVKLGDPKLDVLRARQLILLRKAGRMPLTLQQALHSHIVTCIVSRILSTPQPVMRIALSLSLKERPSADVLPAVRDRLWAMLLSEQCDAVRERLFAAFDAVEAEMSLGNNELERPHR